MVTIALPSARQRSTALARREAIEGLLYISPFLLGFLIFTAYPMIASFYLSFTKYNILNPPTWIGLENYQEAFFKDEQFWNSLRRTAVFALLNVTLGVLGSLGAALLLNQRFRGTTVFRTFFFLPSITPLIVPHWFGGGPLFIFLMRQFFLTIPRDFDEAAKIDGANSLQILWYVLVPLYRPAITSVAIFSFLFHWNAFIEPLIFLNSPEKFTIALGLRYFQTIPMEAGEPKDHLLMAGTIIMIVPCVVLFFLAQRYFVRGIVLSGLKG